MNKKPVVILAAIVALVGLIGLGSVIAQESCTASAPAQTETRYIQVSVDCTNAPFYKISEDPAFEETSNTGVAVNIDSVAEDGSYADVSITYPGGQAGEPAKDFGILNKIKDVRVLIVPFGFEDFDTGWPNYDVQEYARRVFFEGNHDGRGFNNSLSHHFQQSTHGNVSVSGDVWPNRVLLDSIEKFRDPQLQNGTNELYSDIEKAVLTQNPDYFEGNNYDVIVGLANGEIIGMFRNSYNLRGAGANFAHNTFDAGMLYDLPDDGGSLINDYMDEARISTSSTKVITRLSPQTVEGVWLASDVERTGTNYFDGGTLAYDVSNFFVKSVNLGTPLPSENVEVVVRYKKINHYQTSGIQPTDPGAVVQQSWVGLVFHESYHLMSQIIDPDLHLADLYNMPEERVRDYSMMGSGTHLYQKDANSQRYAEPSLLDAYSRQYMGFMQPYELAYGTNAQVRIYRAADVNDAASRQRVKAIRVPLHKQGDFGIRNAANLFRETEEEWTGQEYLLLEWREGSNIANDVYNFDNSLPNNGLVVYRVVDDDPTLHGSNDSSVVIESASDWQGAVYDDLGDFRSDYALMSDGPAPFGPDSGVNQFIASAHWRWKAGATDTSSFLLSEGAGDKTLYVKFMGLDGQVVGQQSISLASNDTEPIAMADTAIIKPADGATITSSFFTTQLETLNGPLDGAATLFKLEGAGTIRRSIIEPDGKSFSRSLRTSDVPTGQRDVTVRFIDDFGRESTQSIQINNQYVDVIPPSLVLINEPQTGQIIAEDYDLLVHAKDNRAIASVRLEHNNQVVSQDSTGAPYHVVISPGQIPAGAATLNVVVTDSSGNEVFETVSVFIQGGVNPPDPVQLNQPDGLAITENSNNQVEFSWQPVAEEGFPVEYRIYRNGSIYAITTQTKYTDTLVEPETTYSYTIAAIDGYNQDSQHSAPLIVTTPSGQDMEPPTQPQNVSANYSAGVVTLQWSESSDNDQVKRYTIQRNNVTIAYATQNSFTDSNVTQGQIYSYIVIAEDLSGNLSSPSASATVTIPAPPQEDTTPPSVPQNLRLIKIRKGVVELEWNAATDNVGIKEYELYRDGVLLGRTVSTSFGDGSAQKSQSYDYHVVAVDTSGNKSGNSNVLSVYIGSSKGKGGGGKPR